MSRLCGLRGVPMGKLVEWLMETLGEEEALAYLDALGQPEGAPARGESADGPSGPDDAGQDEPCARPRTRSQSASSERTTDRT